MFSAFITGAHQISWFTRPEKKMQKKFGIIYAH